MQLDLLGVLAMSRLRLEGKHDDWLKHDKNCLGVQPRVMNFSIYVGNGLSDDLTFKCTCYCYRSLPPATALQFATLRNSSSEDLMLSVAFIATLCTYASAAQIYRQAKHPYICIRNKYLYKCVIYYINMHMLIYIKSIMWICWM